HPIWLNFKTKNKGPAECFFCRAFLWSLGVDIQKVAGLIVQKLDQGVSAVLISKAALDLGRHVATPVAVNVAHTAVKGGQQMAAVVGKGALIFSVAGGAGLFTRPVQHKLADACSVHGAAHLKVSVRIKAARN